MKKAIFALIAVLFALSLVTCGVFDPPEAAVEGSDGFVWDDGQGPLQPGEFFVGIDTGSTSRARSLTKALAEAGSDYFEVIMVDATAPLAPVVHRTTFREGISGRIEAPATIGNYNNLGVFKAYIFAGRNVDKTLLGVGVITGVSDDLTTAFTSGASITGATKRVQFTIQALTNDVNTDGAGTPAAGATSTFVAWGGTNTTLNTEVCKQLMINNFPAPIFLLPKNITVEATYNIKTTTATLLAEAVLVASTFDPDEAVFTKGVIYTDGDGDFPPVTDIAVTMTNQVAGDPLALPFEIEITTLADSGLSRLSIDVPVIMYSDETSANQPIASLADPITWFIRGGLNNAIVDQGIIFNTNRGSMGGAVLLGVGDVLTGAGGIITTFIPEP